MPNSDVAVRHIDVNFLVTGDKKHQTGIYITVYGSDGTRLAYGQLPGSDNQSDFWPAGETHTVTATPVTDFPVSRLKGSRLHIDSGNPDEWHTHIEAMATLSNGTAMEVLQQTGEVGFNWDGQNGQPTWLQAEFSE